MAVKMRWGSVVRLADVTPLQEFVTYKSSVVRIEDLNRFRRVSNVVRVGHYRYKRGIPIGEEFVAVVRNDGHVCRLFKDDTVTLVEYYNEPEPLEVKLGLPKPKKKRK